MHSRSFQLDRAQHDRKLPEYSSNKSNRKCSHNPHFQTVQSHLSNEITLKRFQWAMLSGLFKQAGRNLLQNWQNEERTQDLVQVSSIRSAENESKSNEELTLDPDSKTVQPILLRWTLFHESQWEVCSNALQMGRHLSISSEVCTEHQTAQWKAEVMIHKHQQSWPKTKIRAATWLEPMSCICLFDNQV